MVDGGLADFYWLFLSIDRIFFFNKKHVYKKHEA